MAFIAQGEIVLNKSKQAAMKNEPLYSVGNKNLAGYISVRMYDQESFTGINSQASQSGHPIFVGEAQRSGYPMVLIDEVRATNIVGDNG